MLPLPLPGVFQVVQQVPVLSRQLLADVVYRVADRLREDSHDLLRAELLQVLHRLHVEELEHLAGFIVLFEEHVEELFVRHQRPAEGRLLLFFRRGLLGGWLLLAAPLRHFLCWFLGHGWSRYRNAPATALESATSRQGPRARSPLVKMMQNPSDLGSIQNRVPVEPMWPKTCGPRTSHKTSSCCR